MGSSNANSPEALQLSIAKRRARNRVSQKSFRERQALYVRQLERQLEEASQSESARINSIQEECQQLRKALLAARKRIAGLTTALTGVSDNIGVALGLQNDTSTESLPPETGGRNANDAPPPPADEQHDLSAAQSEPPPAGNQGTTKSSSMRPMNNANPSLEHTSNDLNNLQCALQNFDEAYSQELDLLLNWRSNQTMVTRQNNGNGQQPESQLDATLVSCLNAPRASPRTDNHPRAMPYVEDPYGTVAGLRFGDARITADIQISFPPGNPVFPSVFSAHLAACEFFIKQNNAYKQRDQPGGNEALSKLISNMVNMFVNTAWPDMRVWWAYMQSSRLVERLIRWKLDPSLEAYQTLSPCHRPTATQLATPHPAIIDWGFFPSIRDRVIEVYSYSPTLDQLMCELLASYVVEGDVGSLLTSVGDENGNGNFNTNGYSQKGYFCIWDVVQAIVQNDPEPETPQVHSGTTSIWQDCNNLSENMGGGENNTPPSPFTIDEDEAEDLWTPMPLADIFRSKKAAQTLFKLLRMDRRESVKLHPMFAVNHPELCDDPSIVASGMDCTLSEGVPPVPLPKPLTRETIMNYKMMLWKTQA